MTFHGILVLAGLGIAALLVACVVVLCAILGIGALAFINGFVVYKYWEWFVIGFKPITFIQATGIAVLLRFFTFWPSLQLYDDIGNYSAKRIAYNAVLFYIGLPTIAILIGFSLHLL